MIKDSLSRDDMKPVSAFDGLPAEIQAVLKRAASRGSANGPENMREIVDLVTLCAWVMVPGKKGARQVVVTAGRAYRL